MGFAWIVICPARSDYTILLEGPQASKICSQGLGLHKPLCLFIRGWLDEGIMYIVEHPERKMITTMWHTVSGVSLTGSQGGPGQ